MSSKYERELKNILDERGWVVIRSAGSMGEGDLIAFFPDGDTVKNLALIEVKKTQNADKKYLKSGDRSKEQWRQMYDHAETGIPVIYAVRHTSGSLDGRWRMHVIDTDEYDRDDAPILERDEGNSLQQIFEKKHVG